MAVIKSISVWESTFNLRKPLEVNEEIIGKNQETSQWTTSFLGKKIKGCSLAELRHNCAVLAYAEYYKVHVVNNNNEDPVLIKRKALFDEAVVSRINKR